MRAMAGPLISLKAAAAGAWLVILAFLSGMAVPAAATTAPACHAYSDASVAIAQAPARLDWICGNEGWLDGREVTWLRFTGWDPDRPPRFFTSRITMFESATIAARDESGAMRVARYSPQDATPVAAGAIFGLPLSPATDQTREYIVRIERPHSVTLASESALRREPSEGVPPAALVLLSLALGMLVMPLLFDVMFYLVLRERFVLLHGAMTLSMIAYVLTAGGVITAFVELPVTLLAVAGPLSWALGAGFAGLFMGAFLERDSLPRGGRRAINVTAALATIGAGFCALQLDSTQSFDNQLYFLCSAPLLPVYGAAIGWALWRGSRAAKFLAAAWAPVFVTATDRMLRGLGYYAAPDSIDHALFFAVGFEVIIIAMGVADRFLSIRRERDRALTTARMMQHLSERDSLTGLFNRRVVEDRFASLRKQGFTALAILDLDHFKRINDTFGHARGDDVLRIAGRALDAGDADMMAFRMGGEEFLLLLRGPGAIGRAERRRQEIARAVAQEDLECLVTASMGIVEVTEGALPEVSFATIYARADKLLYEAKAGGRNCMVSERIRAFRPRRGERRVAA